MARKLTLPTYEAGVIAYGKSSKGQMISNTSFTANVEETRFYSLKNTTPLPSSEKVTSFLADKIAKAILQSQIVNDETLMGWGKDKTKNEFYYAEFSGGSANGIEKFVIIPSEKTIICTNIYSHLFYRLVLGYDLLRFVLKGNKATDEERECFEYLSGPCGKYLPTSQYDEATAGLLVESSDKESFVTLADSILYTAKEFDGYTIDDREVNDEVFDFYAVNIQYNILPLVAMHNKTDDMSILTGGVDADGNDETIPEIVPPKILKKKKRANAIPYKDRDYTLMNDTQAKKLPADLQKSRKAAIELFERNKQFFTDEHWEAIVSFYNGRIWKMGLFGPSASGKTTFVKEIAGALKLPYKILTGNAETEKVDIFGSMQLEDGKTVFIDGPIIQMMRYGGLFFFDESNMVNAGVVAGMNNILDDTRTYLISQTNEAVEASPLFRYVEAFNPGYEGTRDINLSHTSRIDEWHKFTGYDEKTETEILNQETGIDKKLAEKMVKIKNNITNKIENEGFGDETTQRVDLRTCISWAKKTMDLEGNALRAAITTVLTPLTKEVVDVKGSSSEKDFTKTDDELIAYAFNEIKNTFVSSKPKMPKKDYKFETYKLK